MKLLIPPPAVASGGRVFAFVNTWLHVVSRSSWWRSGPTVDGGIACDPERVKCWLRVSQAFAADLNGPWELDVSDVVMLCQAFRFLGDELRGLDDAAFHHLMRCIAALDAALAVPDAVPAPASDPANETESAAAE